MKTLSTFLFSIFCLSAFAQTVDITFNVNMEYQEVSDQGVYIAGGGNFGNPGDNQLLDPDGDGIYSITLTRDAGFSSFFIFTNGACPDYSCKENLAGQPCGDPANFNDRFLPTVTEDITLDFCFSQCTTDGTCTPPAESVDVTFSVDMSEQTVAGEVYITGAAIDDWCGTCVPMDDSDGDGIYTHTVALEPGTYEYKYNNGGWDGTETLDATADGECTLTTGDFTNRVVTVEAGGAVTLETNCFEACGACDGGGGDEPVDVTFSVDMSEQTVAGEVYITGAAIDDWCGTCVPMDDSDGDGIYTYTTSLMPGAYEYKYNNGSWDNTEMLDETEDGACTITTDGFTNRLATVAGTEPIVLETNCFEACGACDTGSGEMVDITFNVNTANITVSPDGLFIAGGGNFGNPGDNLLTDPDGDGIYSITLSREMGFSSFYIFTNGACPDYSCKENLVGLPCGNPDNFNDRFLPVVTSNTTVDLCYEQCGTDGSCEPIAEPVDVTFSVDMNDEIVAGDVFITGAAIDDWCGTCVPMADGDGDGVYTITIALPPGAYEYKYNNGSWDDTEMLDAEEDAECTLTTGDFTNRIVEVVGPEPAVLQTNCFARCGSCVTGLDELTERGFSLAPSITDAETVITFAEVISAPRLLSVYSISGALVAQENVTAGVEQYRLSVQDMETGLYIVSMRSEGVETTARLVVTR